MLQGIAQGCYGGCVPIFNLYNGPGSALLVMLHVAWCMLHDVCFMLHVACCMLHVARFWIWRVHPMWTTLVGRPFNYFWIELVGRPFIVLWCICCNWQDLAGRLYRVRAKLAVSLLSVIFIAVAHVLSCNLTLRDTLIGAPLVFYLSLVHIVRCILVP